MTPSEVCLNYESTLTTYFPSTVQPENMLLDKQGYIRLVDMGESASCALVLHLPCK